jgi:hypothetical protein
MPAAFLLRSPNSYGMQVLRKPLVLDDLTVDVMAKVGGLQAVSQCTETVQGPRATGADFSSEFATLDSFAMGQMLYSRLVKLRELASTSASCG